MKSLFFFISINVFLSCVAFDTFSQATSSSVATDLLKRFPETQNVRVSWRKTAYGTLAFYTVEEVSKMSLYNNSAEYVKSFTKETWDDRVPPTVKLEFDNSPYNVCDVVGYWESTVANNKIYYLELVDREDKTSKEVWFDENGKFSKVPF